MYCVQINAVTIILREFIKLLSRDKVEMIFDLRVIYFGSSEKTTI